VTENEGSARATKKTTQLFFFLSKKDSRFQMLTPVMLATINNPKQIPGVKGP
jgi:hypothetical protein